MTRSLAVAALFAAAVLAQPAPVPQFMIRLEPTRAGLTLQNMTDDERRVGAEHAAHLKVLLNQGKLKMAGQIFDPKGLWGIVIVEAPDLQAATAIMNSDPGIQGKLFRGEAAPFRMVFERPVEPAAKPQQ